MRKIILNLAVSLDGFIEGPNGEYDWCFADQDYGMTEFAANTDAIFIGRKSYQLLENETHELFSKKTYVFTDTLTTVKENAEIINSENFLDRIDSIRHAEGKDIWLFGGASLVSSLIKHRYINELLIAVHPIILGAGKPLFEDIKERITLNLTDTQVYNTGLVQLRYTVMPKVDTDMILG